MCTTSQCFTSVSVKLLTCFVRIGVKMKNIRNLSTSAIAEVLDESDSDISTSSMIEEYIESDSDSDTCEYELENGEESEGACGVDASFIAKNNMNWSPIPLPRPIGSTAENIILLPPGATRFAVSRCNDILSTFLLFFPPRVEKIIIENTNKHGRMKFQSKWKDLDESTLRAYIGVLILAGVYRGKNEDLHGLFDARFGRPIFRSIMSEDNFHMITSALRFDDVTNRRQQKPSDKFAPIREFWDNWEALLPMFYNCHANVTIDEQLVGFRGRCSFRQYMPSKPAKYGLKFWLAVDSESGYVWKIQPYLGKPKNGQPEKNQGERVVLELSEGLRGQNITADNFFSSFDLAKKLLQRKLTYVGTVRKNKTFIPPKLLMFKKVPLYTSTFAFSENLTLVSYISHKNKGTVLMSSMHKAGEVDFDSDKKTPAIVSYYNSTKGGVDTADQMIGYYSTKRKTNRWPNVVFSNIVDISALNAFILYSEIDSSWAANDSNRRRADFLRQLAMSLANEYMLKRTGKPRDPFAAELLAQQQASSSSSAPSIMGDIKISAPRKRGICNCCKSKCDAKCIICSRFICKKKSKNNMCILLRK